MYASSPLTLPNFVEGRGGSGFAQAKAGVYLFMEQARPKLRGEEILLLLFTNLYKNWSILGTPANVPQAKQRVSKSGKPFCS